MRSNHVADAIASLEKANADLEPELLSAGAARELLEDYARAEKLVAYGKAALSRKIGDPERIARATGSSLGKAKDVVATGKILAESPDLNDALQHGRISLDQASEIAKAEESAPGTAAELIAVAKTERFDVFRREARKVVLEAEQHRGLGARQRAARTARSYRDDLGMVNLHLRWQPHVGTPLVARAEAEAQRLATAAKKKAAKDGAELEPFDRHLADAWVSLLSGSGKARTRRPELVVVVSHEVAQRGWNEVRSGEVCKIPGVGPIDPRIAKEIARRAFVNAVVCDGIDLRFFKRYTRHIPVEVEIALELGDPPGFDGIACIDCGNRFRTEFDHVEPAAARGPTSHPNLKPRCWSCHRAKTERDRRADKLKPPEP